MPLTVIATFHAKEGHRDALLEAVTETASAVHEEPGCLKYAPHVSGRDRVVLVESWADRDALAKHSETPRFKAMAARLEELLSRPPEIVLATPAAAGRPSHGVL